MPATASTAAAVDRRMAYSMPVARGAGGSSPVGGWPSALCPLRAISAGSACSTAARIEYRSGRVAAGIGHGLFLDHRLGGIWEAASSANRPEPRPTEPNQSV